MSNVVGANNEYDLIRLLPEQGFNGGIIFCELRVASCDLSVASCQLQVGFSHILRVANCELRLARRNIQLKS